MSKLKIPKDKIAEQRFGQLLVNACCSSIQPGVHKKGIFTSNDVIVDKLFYISNTQLQKVVDDYLAKIKPKKQCSTKKK